MGQITSHSHEVPVENVSLDSDKTMLFPSDWNRNISDNRTVSRFYQPQTDYFAIPYSPPDSILYNSHCEEQALYNDYDSYTMCLVDGKDELPVIPEDSENSEDLHVY